MSTVVVTLCDQKYFTKVKRTIQDIRSVGQYWGDLVLIAVDFTPNQNFIDFYQITVKVVKQIDTTILVNKLKLCPFTGGDGRELTKLAQWNKLYCFDIYFQKWNQVIFFDAGFRIFNKISYFINIDYKNHIVAMDDAHPDNVKRFGCQLEQVANKIVLDQLITLVPNLLNQKYFLNCFFIFDSKIINNNTLIDLIDLMNQYPICRTNEMGIMNIYFNFIHKLWLPLKLEISNNLMLIDWSERDGKNWRNYVGLKYPTTINFDI